MHAIYFIARLYPFIVIPLVVIFIELGFFLRRQRSSVQHVCWLLSLFCVSSAVLWIVFRGDLNSDQWVRALLG